MKTLLMVFSKYTTVKSDPYLTNDLVNEVCKQGHRVTVIGYGDASVSRRTANLEEHVLRVPSAKILKYVWLWPGLFFRLLRVLSRNRVYDQIVVTGPLSVEWPAVLLIHLLSCSKKTAIIFDIYPAHQTRIKALPRWSERGLKSLEVLLLKGFTEVTAMGQDNQRHIRDYYFGDTCNIPIKVIHLWARGEGALCRPRHSSGPIKVVFGGQVIKGRSVERLIEFLDAVREGGVDLTLTFYGWGELYDQLRHKCAKQDWIFFYNRVSREEYLALLPGYDVGTVVTDESVELPAFPSKIVDYISARLHCLCLVEEASELYSVLGSYKSVYLNSFDFSESGIRSAVDFFHCVRGVDTNDEWPELDSIFSVSTAVSRVLQ